jgi:hypothetical protein
MAITSGKERIICISKIMIFNDERNEKDILMKGIFSVLLLGLHEISKTGLESEDVYKKIVKNIFRLIEIYLTKQCDSSSSNTSISLSLIFVSILVIFPFLEKILKKWKIIIFFDSHEVCGK